MNLDSLRMNDEKDIDNLAYAARRKPKNPETKASYSGVCDVKKPENALAMANAVRESRKDLNRKILVGEMASPHSLHHEDGDDMPNRSEIADSFIDDPDVLNAIHFADLYEKENQPRKGGETPNLPENLELCIEYGGENLHALQLDVIWPNTNEIKAFREKHPKIQIILQVSQYAMDELGNDAQDIADRLLEYGDSIDYVLLDLSMGKGREMTETDVVKLQRLLSVIQFKVPGLGLAVAGGLGPVLETTDSSGEVVDRLYALRKIAKEFPSVSIDAQGGVKPDNAPIGFSGHLDASTPADLGKSLNYIKAASALLDNEIGGKPHKPSYIAA
jgi:hypothetical protein